MLSREYPVILPEDLRQLLLAFNAEAVEYLVVGGYVVGIYLAKVSDDRTRRSIRGCSQAPAAIRRAIVA